LTVVWGMIPDSVVALPEASRRLVTELLMP
jgi:hypothetical protein